MSADASILCYKIRLDKQCMIAHLTELNQNDIENGAGHIHGKRGDRRQHAHSGERIECIQIGSGKNIADFHQCRFIHRIKLCRLAALAPEQRIYKRKGALARNEKEDVARCLPINAQENTDDNQFR